MAQEARGAAKALREGVTQLTSQPPNAPDESAAPAVEMSLDALDDTIRMLDELQSGGAGTRRGRIDVAALLYELAPNARLAMEPGAGTEVFGDETVLRRMLHVLVNQAGSPGTAAAGSSPEMRIRRRDEWVEIAVELGPDQTAHADLEQRWLSRMATRMGGSVELDRGHQRVLLPADAGEAEVKELRAELEQAQQLGEVYARELASVLETGAAEAETDPEDPAAATPGAPLAGLAASLARTLRGTFEPLRTDVRDVANKLGADDELIVRLGRRVSAGYELIGELERLAACTPSGTSSSVDVAALSASVAEAAAGRAARHGVSVEVLADGEARADADPNPLELLLRSLVDHAIAATPKGDAVRIRMETSAGALRLSVSDGGPVVPRASRDALLVQSLDASSMGRPEGIALACAVAAANMLGTSLELGTDGEGRARASVNLPAG